MYARDVFVWSLDGDLVAVAYSEKRDVLAAVSKRQDGFILSLCFPDSDHTKHRPIEPFLLPWMIWDPEGVLRVLVGVEGENLLLRTETTD